MSRHADKSPIPLSEFDPLPKASRELAETGNPDLDAREEASELFVHALLTANSEESGASGEREQRLQRIFDAIQKTPPPRHRLPVRAFVAAAATILLVLGGFLVWRHLQTERVRSLLALALETNRQGVHVFTARRVVHDADGSTDERKYQLALGGDNKFHVRIDGLRHGSVSFGSNGKVVWAKSPFGECFELGVLEPGMTLPGLLGADLSYYELQELFKKCLTAELDVLGFEQGIDGRVALLSGSYDVASDTTTALAYGYPFPTRGRLQLAIEEATGLILHLKMTSDPDDSATHGEFELRRFATPRDPSRLGIVFDPPRYRTPFMVKLLTGLARLWLAVKS